MKLLERAENSKELKKLQLDEIEELEIGTKFWVRKNRTSSTEIDPPRNPGNYLVYKMPTPSGVKYRLDKINRSAEFTGVERGEWKLFRMST